VSVEATGAGLQGAVCVRPLAQRRHATGVAWRVGAGGGAMSWNADLWLVDAAERGDMAGIAAALLAGADPNAYEGTDDLTPLRLATDSGHLHAMTALLAAGARANGENNFGTTPLMFAAWNADMAAIDALLAAGADVNHAQYCGDTSLHHASRNGELDVARVLLDAGARMDLRTDEDKRPIDLVRALV
jgi:uncharacterized protein